MSTTITLPITSEALKRLAAEAQAQGITPEAHAVGLLEHGFGVPAAEVIATVLGDAAAEAAHRGGRA